LSSRDSVLVQRVFFVFLPNSGPCAFVLHMQVFTGTKSCPRREELVDN
jgi:hypothetical protein